MTDPTTHRTTDLAARLLLYPTVCGCVAGAAFFVLAGFEVPPFAEGGWAEPGAMSSWGYASGSWGVGLVAGSVVYAAGGAAIGVGVALVTAVRARVGADANGDDSDGAAPATRQRR